MSSTCDLGTGSAPALKPYPVYKPSGVDWLGEVPAHWRIVRNGQIFVQRIETGFPELPILEVSLNTGVRVRNFENLDRKQIMTVRSEYKRAVGGDIAYNMMRMWQGAVGVTPVDGLVSSAYVVARPLDGTDPRYFSALFRTGAYTTEVDRSSRGIVKDRNRLYWIDFKQMASPCPPFEEQAAIARYLDHADRRIRRCIQAKEKLVELLEEQRQALINEAVTGRFDVRTGQPFPAYKPSGVEWLREVPAHWEVRRLKTGVNNVLNLTSDRRDDEIYLALEHVESWTGRVRSAEPDIRFDSQVKQFAPGDVLFGKLRPYLAKVAHPHRSGVCVGEFLVLRPRTSGLDSAYLARFLRSRQTIDAINASTFGAKMPRAEWGFIGSLACPLPPLPEQAAIASYLDHADEHIRCGIQATTRQIELLGEYRTRLISDVVTGKLDVRDAAAALSERDTLSTESAGDSSTETAATPPSGLDPMPKATQAPA